MLPAARVVATERDADALVVSLQLDDARFAKSKKLAAAFALAKITRTVDLERASLNGIEGYLSDRIEAFPGTDAGSAGGDGSNGKAPAFDVALSQGLFANGTGGADAFATAIFTPDLARVTGWDWLRPAARIVSGFATELSWPERGAARIFAYANVALPGALSAERLRAEIAGPPLSKNASGAWAPYAFDAAEAHFDSNGANRIT